MRKISFFLVFILFFVSCGHKTLDIQAHPDEAHAFIKWYRTDARLDAGLILADEPISGSQFDGYKEVYSDTVFLTVAERGQIRKVLSHPPVAKWTRDFFPEAQIITQQDIDVVFKSPGRDGWEEFHKRYGYRFYQCSTPIFLREGTLCLFYTAYHCGWLCGEGQLTLYQRSGNTWIRLKDYLSWVS